MLRMMYVRNSASARDRPILFTKGSFLPLEEAAPLTDLTHALLRAAQVRSPDSILEYSRPQLCLFAPGAELDGARDHIQDLQDAGINDPVQVTVIHYSESEHNIRQECTNLCNHLQEKDVWQLQGPGLLLLPWHHHLLYMTQMQASIWRATSSARTLCRSTGSCRPSTVTSPERAAETGREGDVGGWAGG